MGGPSGIGCGASGPALRSRREMLERSALGFGWLALCALEEDRRGLAAGVPPAGTTTGRARSVILLFMGGGPSHVDTWDPKPLLAELHGKDVPASIAQTIPRIARSPLDNLHASPFRFTRHGQSGIEVSALFPETGRMVDDLCVLRSCRHDTPIHAPAEYLATTGSQVGDRPSLGSWITYGLGSENQNLPAFIVMTSDGSAGRPPAWSAGFLPASFQGTLVDAGKGIANLDLPAGTTRESRRRQLDFLVQLNRHHLARLGSDSEIEARIRAYELAFRMQATAPEAFDLGRESKETWNLYGLDVDETAEFGAQCLLARRLVERGVRFVQLRSGQWDHHNDLENQLRRKCRQTDRPISALLADLKRRGLLDQTLVVWGGEFGRTPAVQGGAGKGAGRDHSPSGYSMWMAGGGVRGGQVIGATDPVGYAAVEKPVHPRDLHATILHALGIDQHTLYYVHQNRKESVTLPAGRVIDAVFG